MADPTPAAPPAESEAKTPADAGISVHIVSPRVLLGVFASLIVLTYLTVTATYINLGDWNLLIAMGIATIKAGLVALFFMHLLYDKSFYMVIFLAALLFVGLFISGTLLDTLQYQPSTHPWAAPASMAQ